MDVKQRWLLAGAGTLLVLVAVSILPPRACDPGTRSSTQAAFCSYGFSAAGKHSALVERTRNQFLQALWRRELLDSLVTRAGVRSVRSGPITVYYERPLSADSARRWLRLAEHELTMIPGTGRGSAVAVVLLTDPERPEVRDERSTLTVQNWYQPPLDRYATRAHGGACVIVYRMREGSDVLLRQQRPALLDWCALHARFGEPGAGIAPWVSLATTYGWRERSSIAELVQSGGDALSWPSDGYEVRACQAGSAALCMRYIGMSAPGASRPFFFRGPTRDVLAWLVATGEPGQFARFWRADGPPSEAIAAGFGRPVGEILQSWSRERYRTQVQPRSRAKLVLAGALWFSLAMVAAFVAMQRRQVG